MEQGRESERDPHWLLAQTGSVDRRPVFELEHLFETLNIPALH